MVFLRLCPAVIGLFVLLAPSLTAAPTFLEWSAPQNLGPVVNSSATDAAPAISKDGLSLYFNSNRTGGVGANDIWVSKRDRLTEPWGAPVNLGAVVNTVGIEASPAVSRDGHWLFFHSNRSGNMDIWVSYRQHTHDDSGWQAAVNAGPGVNSAFEESMGGFFENDNAGARPQPGRWPQIFFASNRPGVGAFDLYSSTLRRDDTFGPATLITELSDVAAEPGLMVSVTGLEAFFYSGRPGGIGGQDLWTATRRSILAAWSSPVNLGPLVNSAEIDQRPYIAYDRQTLFFGSDRPGGHGGLDLYVTTRSKR
jgi:hypothetical protein